MSRPVTVYAEMTPNPATIKFVADVMLINNGESVEFLSKEECKDHSKFADALFNFPFVSGVFISGNFVTVTKSAAIEWNIVMQSLREFILEWIADNEIIIDKIPDLRAFSVADDNGTALVSEEPEINTELDRIIFELLEEYVKPAVESDGGAIYFKSFDPPSGKVTVVLKGSCSGCPSSTATLKGGIETLLKSHVPEVAEVVALNG
ncbi:MAG: NifU family protein [Flavobacteriales bacterium]|nr:NifU family protein [Flavobacteriales bacterium]